MPPPPSCAASSVPRPTRWADEKPSWLLIKRPLRVRLHPNAELRLLRDAKVDVDPTTLQYPPYLRDARAPHDMCAQTSAGAWGACGPDSQNLGEVYA